MFNVERIFEAKRLSRELKKERIISLKRQFAGIKSRNYENIDPEMIPFLDYFNSIPGVATTWCCSGHYVLGDVRGRTMLKPGHACSPRHVGLITNAENGGLIIEAIRDCIRGGGVTDRAATIKVSVNHSRLTWKFFPEELRGDGLDHPERWYMSWTLELHPYPLMTDLDEFNKNCLEFLETLKVVYEALVQLKKQEKESK